MANNIDHALKSNALMALKDERFVIGLSTADQIAVALVLVARLYVL